MKYMLLIYTSESLWAGQDASAAQAIMSEYRGFTESIQTSGHMVGGDRLDSTSTATTVRVRDRKTLTTDGPYAETKEQLAGYYIVEAKDIDEAIGIAARIPGARYGAVEVRPIPPMPAR